MQVQQLAHQPEAAAEETVFSESLSYISATSTASQCIFVFHISTICTAAEETVFSSSCIVDCTLCGAPTKRLFRKVIIFQALSFTFASRPCSIIWEMNFVFWTKHRTIELVCKRKWSYEIQVWKKDMSNFSHETLLDLSYHNIPSKSGEYHCN